MLAGAYAAPGNGGASDVFLQSVTGLEAFRCYYWFNNTTRVNKQCTRFQQSNLPDSDLTPPKRREFYSRSLALYIALKVATPKTQLLVLFGLRMLLFESKLLVQLVDHLEKRCLK